MTRNGKTITLLGATVYVDGRAIHYPSPAIARQQYNRVLRYRSVH